MSLNGIDISSNNKRLDLSSYTGSVVINKLTGGTSYFWKENRVNDCLKKGLLTGVYHFAHEYKIIKPSKTQAEYFYQHYKKYRGKVLPILDYEVPLNGKYFTQHDMNWIDNFMIHFKKLSGVNAVLYCSKSLVWSTKIPKFTKNNCMLWFAQYGTMEPTGWQRFPWTDKHQLDMNIIGQQYTSNGHIQGITGGVDLSVFYISHGNWLKACRPSK